MSGHSFHERNALEEQMDDLEVRGSVVDRTLKELDTINKWLGGNQVTILGLEKLLGNCSEISDLSITDLGCGSGRMLQLIREWGIRQKIDLSLLGVDANEYIAAYAAENSTVYPEITVCKANIFDSDFQQQEFDVITSTLFTHHFDRSQLVELISTWIRQCNYGVVINDLHRHWLAYYSIKSITSVFSKSEMVRQDAPVSVLRGFVKSDWVRLMKDCGIKEYYLSWHWAFRWLLVIPKVS